MERALQSKSSEVLEAELDKDTRARKLYEDFARIGHTFLERSDQSCDLDRSPSRVVLSKIGHEVTARMAARAGCGPLDLAIGLFRGFDHVSTGPKMTGQAELSTSTSDEDLNFEKRFDSFEAKTASGTYKLSRDAQDSPIMRRDHFQIRRGQYTTTTELSETLTMDKSGRLIYDIERRGRN